MGIWLKIYGNYYRFSCYKPMKPYTIEEIFAFIENAETMTDLAEISRVLQLTAALYSPQENDAFLLLMNAKRDIILNNDTLPQKE